MRHIDYKWIALSNTTLGMVMATINASSLLIALPAIFRGIHLNPLDPNNFVYLLWILMGYGLVMAVLVVLDEATAHLDSESERAVQLALKTALAGRTSLVIAHRLSTVRDADQILVLRDGRIEERGRHDELLAAGGLYAELYRTQFRRQGAPDGDEPYAPDDEVVAQAS